MKIKIICFTVLSFFLTGKIAAQLRPESFSLTGKSSLAKSLANASSSIADNGISDIITIGDTIWIGTNSGVGLSTDNGNTWANFTGDKVFGSEGISTIGYYKGVFWAATAHDIMKDNQSISTGSGLKYTSDLGKTWTSIPQPKDSSYDSVIVYGINRLSALPITVDPQNVTYDIAFTPGTVWIASWAGGIRKSKDMGKTWQRVVLPPDFLDSVSPNDTLNFCLSPDSGKICNEGNFNHEGFSIIAINDSTLYAGTAGGINKSTDGGISWTKFTHQNQQYPISGNFIVALGYNKFDNTVWSASWQANDQNEFNAVSYSSDGGQNWKTTLNGEKVHNFAFQNSKIIAPCDNGAFGSPDGGLTWTLPGNIQDQNSKLSLTTSLFYSAGFNGNYLWLGTDNGLARLQNNGGSLWSGDWKIFFASAALSSSTGTYAYPNPFNPRLEFVKIKFSTNNQSLPVTIRIFDFGMHFVRTVIQDAQRGNPVHTIDSNGGVVENWDGRDQNGKVVPNGVYFYRVDAGSMKPVYGKILVIH